MTDYDLIDPGANWCPDCGLPRGVCDCEDELPEVYGVPIHTVAGDGFAWAIVPRDQYIKWLNEHSAAILASFAGDTPADNWEVTS